MASIHLTAQEIYAVGGEHYHASLADTLGHESNNPKAEFSACKCIPSVALFMGRQDGKLLVWNYGQKGCLLPQGHLFGGHAGPILSIDHTVRHDNTQLLFTGSADRTIKIWDPTRPSLSEPCIQTLNAHGGSVTVVKIAGNTLISCSIDRTIKLWQPDKGRTLLLHPWYVCTQTVTNGGSWPTCLCLRSADLSSTFVGDYAGGISVYTTANSRERVDPTNEDQLRLKRQHNYFHKLGITQVLPIADQNVIVSLSFDTTANIFDATTGVSVMKVENPNHCRFTGCDWDQSNHELILADEKGYLYIWSIDTEKCLKTQRLVKDPIVAVSVFPGGDLVLIVLATGATAFHIQRDSTYVECHGHKDAIIAAVALVPLESDPSTSTGDSALFTASIDNSLRCWDSYDLRVLYGFEETEGELSCMAYNAAYHRLLTGNENGNIKQWNVDNGQYFTTRLHRNTVSCIITVTLGSHEIMISADYDGIIWIWELLEGEEPVGHSRIQSKEQNCSNEVYSLAFNKGEYLMEVHSEYFAAGDSNGDIRLYSFDDQEILSTLSNHHEPVTCIVFDGCFMFSGSDDCSIKIWNVLNPRQAYELGFIQAHTMPVRDLILLPTTGFLVSCAHDGKIRVWNYQVCGSFGQYAALIHEFKKNEKLQTLTYWPSRNSIVCGSADKNLLVFQVPMTLITPGSSHESIEPV